MPLVHQSKRRLIVEINSPTGQQKTQISANGTVDIRPTAVEDWLYECEASNKLGKISKEIRIKVYGNFGFFWKQKKLTLCCGQSYMRIQ